MRPLATLARLVTLPALLLAAPPAAAGDAAAPHKVTAKYELLFGGARIARFYFDGDIDGAAYQVKGRARASTFGKLVLDFKGWTSAAGNVHGAAPVPKSYELKVVSGGTRTTSMQFNAAGVGKLAIDPPVRGKKSRVPLTGEHRVNVLDPMSAAVLPVPAGALTGDNACARRLPVFTGRERFDLVLSFKRTETIRALKGKGTTTAYVCKVKYEPIAGHRKNRDENEYMAASEDIEIWLAPVPQTRTFMPYRAILPTPVGTVTLALEGMSIKPAQQRADAAGK